MIPGISRTPQRLALRVDASKCTGHGVCVEVAPALFGLDRFGFAYVRPGADELLVEDAEARVLALEAAVRCPAAAIIAGKVPVAAAPAPPDAPLDRAAPEAVAAGDPAPRLGGPGEPEPLAAWQAAGGFGPVDGAALVAEVDRAGLKGHGGARFPVAAKWRSLGRGEAVVVANGAEREPGTTKDRYLMARRPFAVLDGVRAVAAAVGARQAIVAIDDEHAEAIAAMGAALAEAGAQGVLGDLAVEVRRVPARYVAGEETALLEAIDGAEPRPHVRPPYPTQKGWRGRPTVVHNVETLVQVALIAARGAAWFRSAGTPGEPGTGLFSVGRFDGPVEVVERPHGYPLRDLLAEAGGPGSVTAVVVGGWSGGLLAPGQLDVALTHDDLCAVGASLGTKSIQVLGPDRCVVGAAAEVLAWFAAESAGQCPPCYQGLPYLAEVLAGLEAGTTDAEGVAEARLFADTLPRRGACALPDGAVRFLRSLFEHFPDEVEAHLASGCPHPGDVEGDHRD